MHLEVRQNGPGSCPKCGMALELQTPVIQASKTQWTCHMHPEVVRDNYIEMEPFESEADGLRAEGRTVMYIAVDGKAAGLVAVSVVGNALRLRRKDL